MKHNRHIIFINICIGIGIITNRELYLTSGIRAWLLAITPACYISVLAFCFPVHCQTACSISIPVACIVCVILLETCLTLILGILHTSVKLLLHCTLWRCILECPPPWDKGILVVSWPQSRVLSLIKNVWPVLSLPACRSPFLTTFWVTNFVLRQFFLVVLSHVPVTVPDLSFFICFEILPIQVILQCCSLISYPPWLTRLQPSDSHLTFNFGYGMTVIRSHDQMIYMPLTV